MNTLSVALPDDLQVFVEAQTVQRGYLTRSEYLRDLIRREQMRNAGLEALRTALIEGEASGEPRPFDSKAFKQKIARRA